MNPTTTLRQLTDEAWERALRHDPATALRLGREVDALPRGGPEDLDRAVSTAGTALRQLDAIDTSALGRDDRLTHGFLRDHLGHEVAEAERYWFRFPVTPFNALRLSIYHADVFGRLELGTAEDVDRYLHLLDDYAARVEQVGDTVEAQRRRGIRLPRWAVGTCLDTIRGYAAGTGDLVPAAPRRAPLGAGPAGRLADGSRRLVEGRVAAAYARILADLEVDARGNEDGVGIGQYEGGADCYAGLVRLGTGLDLTAERVHEIGLAEVARLTERIRSELGITDEQEYRRRLAADPASYAADPADLERRYQGHVDRLGTHLDAMFASLPSAPFRIRRLDPALEGGLTYGYYEPPGTDGCGYYHYNGSDLANRPLVQAASVMFHEGMPGHHLQLGRQLENTALHPLRREMVDLRTVALAGYFEGWAEYAAGLCDELGLYDTALDRYGRLSSERFHAARLVVDTGLNVLGWQREQAAAYLATNGFLSEVEVGTELLRYAIDDPGQALAYHLGHWYLRELRGDSDPRAFHEAVLADGPLPLALLGEQFGEAHDRATTPG